MDEKEAKFVEYIKNKYPQLNICNVEFDLSNSMHNNIVIVDHEAVFKFSRYDWTVAFLANEAKIINFLRQYVDMPLPHMEYIYPGIATCEFIKGGPLFRNEILQLKDSDQNYIAKQIGTFLKQLHSIPLKTVEAGNIDQISTDLSREAFLSEYDDIQRKVYPYCDSYVKTSIQQIFAPILEDEDFLRFHPALIHADPAPRRFICDKKLKKINAVIGFGSAGIGDPAFDMGVILDSFGESFLKRISRYYGDITKLIDRARFYAYFNHLNWAKKTADMITTRDFLNFRVSIQISDVMPIGSRW